MSGSELRTAYSLPAPDKVICPGCKKSIFRFTHAQAVNMSCDCGKILKVTDVPQVIGTFKTKVKSAIPIGSKANFGGVVFRVVGFINYRQGKTIYTWNEYVLFNPATGYAVLSEFDGHWNFCIQTLVYPRESYSNFKLGPFDFRIFNEYKANVVAAVGEFHWDILDTSDTKVTEYISPPFMLIKEKSADHLLWYKAEYKTPVEIQAAFDVKISLPYKSGIGANQPLKVVESYPFFKKFSFAVMGILFVIQFLFSIGASDEVILSENYSLHDSVSRETYVTPSFKVDGGIFGKTNLEMTLNAPVDNGWFELGITLVNEETGEEYYFEQGVEYYYGYDGGRWTEGSTNDTKVLSSIPEGRYHLNITSYQSEFKKIGGFGLKLVRDVTNWSNFFIIIAILIVPMLLQMQRVSYLEFQRWQNSDLA